MQRASRTTHDPTCICSATLCNHADVQRHGSRCTRMCACMGRPGHAACSSSSGGADTRTDVAVHRAAETLKRSGTRCAQTCAGTQHSRLSTAGPAQQACEKPLGARNAEITGLGGGQEIN